METFIELANLDPIEQKPQLTAEINSLSNAIVSDINVVPFCSEFGSVVIKSEPGTEYFHDEETLDTLQYPTEPKLQVDDATVSPGSLIVISDTNAGEFINELNYVNCKAEPTSPQHDSTSSEDPLNISCTKQQVDQVDEYLEQEHPTSECFDSVESLPNVSRFSSDQECRSSDNVHMNKRRRHYNKPSRPGFVCIVCGMRLELKMSLRRHQEYHLKLYKCPHCHLAFNAHERLINHLKKHTDFKFKCDQCDSFVGLKKLKDHKCTQEEICKQEAKSFKCKICGSIVCLKNLRLHKCNQEAIQGKPEPLTFKCKGCDYSCNKNDELTVHVKETHQVPKDFAFHCEICGQAFATDVEYRLHRTQVHRRPRILRYSTSSLNPVARHSANSSISSRVAVTLNHKKSHCNNNYKHLTFRVNMETSIELANVDPVEQKSQLTAEINSLRNAIDSDVNVVPFCGEFGSVFIKSEPDTEYFHDEQTLDPLRYPTEQKLEVDDATVSPGSLISDTNAGEFIKELNYVNCKVEPTSLQHDSTSSEDPLDISCTKQQVDQVDELLKQQHPTSESFDSIESLSNVSQFPSDQECRSSDNVHGNKRRHDAIEPSQIGFICFVCGLRLESQLSLRRHEDNLHMKPYKCPHCHSRFYDHESIINHLQKHTTGFPVRCDRCDLFVELKRLRNHKCMLEEICKQEAKSFRCVKCDLFVNFKNLRFHKCSQQAKNQSIPEPPTFKCKVCDYSSAQNDELRVHMMVSHEDPSVDEHTVYVKETIDVPKYFAFHCEICGQGIATAVEYRLHRMQVHRRPRILR